MRSALVFMIFACVFVVVVHTSEDMITLKRVNHGSLKLIENIRRKLIADNDDYTFVDPDVVAPSHTPPRQQNSLIYQPQPTRSHLIYEPQPTRSHLIYEPQPTRNHLNYELQPSRNNLIYELQPTRSNLNYELQPSRSHLNLEPQPPRSHLTNKGLPTRYYLNYYALPTKNPLNFELDETAMLNKIAAESRAIEPEMFRRDTLISVNDDGVVFDEDKNNGFHQQNDNDKRVSYVNNKNKSVFAQNYNPLIYKKKESLTDRDADKYEDIEDDKRKDENNRERDKNVQNNYDKIEPRYDYNYHPRQDDTSREDDTPVQEDEYVTSSGDSDKRVRANDDKQIPEGTKRASENKKKPKGDDNKRSSDKRVQENINKPNVKHQRARKVKEDDYDDNIPEIQQVPNKFMLDEMSSMYIKKGTSGQQNKKV